MRLALALGLLLALALAPVPAQQAVQGPEPGVFIYGYDQATSLFTRTYYPTQQEATAVLQPRWAAAEAAAAQLNALCQSNVNTHAVAEWMVFCEQWTFWQEWVKQEYELGDITAQWHGEGTARFAAVPGTTLWWEQGRSTEGNGPGGGPGGRGNAQNSRGGEGGATAGREGGGEGREGGVSVPGRGDVAAEYADAAPGLGTGLQQEAPAETAAMTLATFLAIPDNQREQGMENLHTVFATIVQQIADAKYQALFAILDEIDADQEARARRAAFIATRQRDITDLREIILNEEAATPVNVEGTTYLFSEQPLTRIPAGAVNLTTPNLTPYDIFNADGSTRQGQPEGPPVSSQ